MKTILFLTIMLVAPVAGAEEILFNNCMKLHANTENEPLCDRFRDQPAEEAKPTIQEDPFENRLCAFTRSGKACVDMKKDKFDCPEIDCGLNNPSGKMCTTDKNGCAVYVQSDAEKWRYKCKSTAEYMSGIDCDDACMSFWANIATAYCTRYNSALLEEMRNN